MKIGSIRFRGASGILGAYGGRDGYLVSFDVQTLRGGHGIYRVRIERRVDPPV